MSQTKAQKLAQFTIALDRGEEAQLYPVLAPELVHQLMLANQTQKAPARARQLGVHPHTFNRYQRGESSPTLHRAVKLLDLLGYDILIRKRQ